MQDYYIHLFFPKKMKNERLDFLVKKYRDEDMDFGRIRKYLEAKGFSEPAVKESFLRFTDKEVSEQLSKTDDKNRRVWAVLVAPMLFIAVWNWVGGGYIPFLVTGVWILSALIYFLTKEKITYNLREEMREARRDKGRRDEYIEMNHFFDP